MLSGYLISKFQNSCSFFISNSWEYHLTLPYLYTSDYPMFMRTLRLAIGWGSNPIVKDIG